MTDGNRSNETRITPATGRKAASTEVRFEVHELNLNRLESDFKKAERDYFEARDRKADGEIAQAQRTLDLDAARNTLRDLAATTKTIAGEALEDTRSYTVNPKAKPMRLADKDAEIANVRMPLVNAEAANLDLDAIYVHLENTLIHEEKALMYCWILAAERRIKEIRASNVANLPDIQRDMADLNGLVQRSKKRLEDNRNDATRERAVNIAMRASSLTRRSRDIGERFKGADVVTPKMKQYSFVGENDVRLPPLE